MMSSPIALQDDSKILEPALSFQGLAVKALAFKAFMVCKGLQRVYSRFTAFRLRFQACKVELSKFFKSFKDEHSKHLTNI